MRLCAAIALVPVALVVVTVQASQRQPTRASAAPSLGPAPAEPLRGPASPPMRAPPSPAPSESGGIAHLRGRLLMPAGVEPTDGLVVVAEGVARQFRAHIPDDAR